MLMSSFYLKHAYFPFTGSVCKYMTWVINQKLWHSSYLAFDIFSSTQAPASRETKQLKRALRHHRDPAYNK